MELIRILSAGVFLQRVSVVYGSLNFVKQHTSIFRVIVSVTREFDAF